MQGPVWTADSIMYHNPWIYFRSAKKLNTGNSVMWITLGMVALTVISAVKKLRQEDGEFQVSLVYTARSCHGITPETSITHHASRVTQLIHMSKTFYKTE